VSSVVAATRVWVESVVIGLDLCPFAGPVLEQGRVRFVESVADDPGALLEDLDSELARLLRTPVVELETTLLIHPRVLGDFAEGSTDDDAANWTNRSPHPMLHLLREQSVADAIAAYGDVSAIPERNIERLRALPAGDMSRRLARCRSA